jgi:TIR domain
MSYLNDIFISYRRNPDTLYWINEHFLPLLRLRLGFELQRAPVIYVDTGLESGTSWPIQLGTELGRSRVLMVLWSANYLSSRWCTLELSEMVARERKTRRRTLNNPKGLVIPAMIHDGEKFPQHLQDIQYFEIQKYFNVRMAKYSERAAELDDIIAAQAPDIAQAINSAPPWRAQWPKTAAQNMYKLLFRDDEAPQKTLPRFAAR